MALIHIGGKSYEIVHENRNGWNPEAFRDRYSEVLERYDYIVGDWGYNQLRLKGFFRDNHSKATKDSNFSGMPDYINEYCNFGCAYFVLEKKESNKKEPGDYDFDTEELKPRTDARMYRMTESAGLSEAEQIDESAAAKETAEIAAASERHSRGAHRIGGGQQRTERSDRSERNDRGDRHERNERAERHARSERSERVERTDRSERTERGERNDRGDRGERNGQQHRKGFRGNDQRNRKNARIGANESAAAAETSPHVRTNSKDAGRS